MRNSRVVFLLAALLAAAPGVARFRVVEVEQVPVDRLIGNLEAEIEAIESVRGDATPTRRNLARVHAIAAARAVAALDVRPGTNDLRERPHSRGFLQSLGDDVPANADAASHLASAIRLYEAVLESDRYDVRSRLGLAWAFEQAGREREALEQYRLVADAAWPLENGALTSLYAGSMTIFQEAATAVLRYLDRTVAADAAEAADLERRLATFDTVPRFVSPILVPLDDDAAFSSLVDAEAGVAFDLDGSGLPRRWGWITPRAAWLVWDPQGSGRIESGLQLFGAVAFFVFWDDGYEALAALDDDGDGRLTGDELDGLALWADVDGDGTSDPGEVRPVTAHGIVSIATESQRHADGFPFNPAGIEMTDGSTRATYDWIVASKPIS